MNPATNVTVGPKSRPVGAAAIVRTMIAQKRREITTDRDTHSKRREQEAARVLRDLQATKAVQQLYQRYIKARDAKYALEMELTRMGLQTNGNSLYLTQAKRSAIQAAFGDSSSNRLKRCNEIELLGTTTLLGMNAAEAKAYLLGEFSRKVKAI